MCVFELYRYSLIKYTCLNLTILKVVFEIRAYLHSILFNRRFLLRKQHTVCFTYIDAITLVYVWI